MPSGASFKTGALIRSAADRVGGWEPSDESLAVLELPPAEEGHFTQSQDSSPKASYIQVTEA